MGNNDTMRKIKERGIRSRGIERKTRETVPTKIAPLLLVVFPTCSRN